MSMPSKAFYTPPKQKTGAVKRNGPTYKSFQISKHQEKIDVCPMFEKKFFYKKQLSSGIDWKLPAPTELFKEYYRLDSTTKLKERLNEVKSRLNDYVIEDWSAHTRRKDPAGEIPWRLKNDTKAEFVTVAWCKFFECLQKFSLVSWPRLNSLHLCEAPGAFIAALNHYLYTKYDKDQVQWKWLSTTLNPYFEGNPLNKMIIDDRFILYTLDHWLFHDDFTGNILSVTNIESMTTQCNDRLGAEVHLITADGSIDCVEVPGGQEEHVASLHFAEIVAALIILAEGGCFVIKMFTLFEATSVCKMYLLNCCFEEVHVFKPITSKRGNSEVYVICLGYKKHKTPHLNETLQCMKEQLSDTPNGEKKLLPLFSKAHLPAEFLLQHEICVRLFMNLQIQAIEANIYSYELKSPYDSRQSHALRTHVCNEFYARYNVLSLEEELTILYQRHGKEHSGLKMQVYRGSYTEREMLKRTTIEQHVYLLRRRINELERSLNLQREILLLEKDQVKHTPLRLYRGAIYRTLESSLFCSVHMLLLRRELLEIFADDPLWHAAPICRLDYDCQIPFIADGKKNFMELQAAFFRDILKALIKHKPCELRFTHMPFLTHYSVSLLLYLSHNVFNRLKICTEPTFEITLYSNTADRNHEVNSLSQLQELQDLLLKNDVLCFLNLFQLHRNDYWQALVEYNDLLLLDNCKKMLHVD